jgi:hypothetical protein
MIKVVFVIALLAVGLLMLPKDISDKVKRVGKVIVYNIENMQRIMRGYWGHDFMDSVNKKIESKNR